MTNGNQDHPGIQSAAMPPGPRWVPIAGIAIISFVLSGVMSVFMVAVNLGFRSDYLIAVLASWALGFVVSFPASLVVVPLVVRWQERQAGA